MWWQSIKQLKEQMTFEYSILGLKARGMDGQLPNTKQRDGDIYRTHQLSKRARQNARLAPRQWKVGCASCTTVIIRWNRLNSLGCGSSETIRHVILISFISEYELCLKCRGDKLCWLGMIKEGHDKSWPNNDSLGYRAGTAQHDKTGSIPA